MTEGDPVAGVGRGEEVEGAGVIGKEPATAEPAFLDSLGRNEAKGPRISAARRPPSAWVIPTNEELMIARHTGQRLGLIAARAERGGAGLNAC